MLASLRSCATLLAAVGAVALPSSASAAVGVDRFEVTTSTSVAGAHPDLGIEVQLPLGTTPLPGNSIASPLQRPRDLRIDLPAGLVGDPTAVPRCTTLEFIQIFGCPYGSQIGVAQLDIGMRLTTPVWILEPALPGETARLGIRAQGLVPATIAIRPRSEGDFGLRSEALSLPQWGGGVSRIALTLWGDPASAAHDGERLTGLSSGACGDDYTDPSNPVPLPCPHPAAATAGAFLSNPTACGPLTAARLRLDSWEEPGQFTERESTLDPITDCASVPLAPSVSVTADDPRPDTPSGYRVKLTVPQAAATAARSTSHVRTVDLTLPPGVVISPAGANGLVSCSDEQLRLGTDESAACPGASSIASATIDVPLLDEPLHGSVYLRPPEPGHLFRLVIAADGPGLHLKIPGEATPDPSTGQLRAVFDNAPQQPFSDLELHFDGGPQAALANPQSCSTALASGEVLGWNGLTAPVSSVVGIDQGCADRGFAPAVSAGTTDATAGRATGFTLTVRRADGEQNLGVLDAQLPAGVSAFVSSVALCSNTDAAAGRCPESSRIGGATAGAGSGPAPIYLSGGAYLTEGYGGAPYGMAFVVPAKVGPFDLGDVSVRARVFVDRATAALRVLSDPLPTIIQGVPLRLRELRIAIDRPGFMLNPTSCAAKQVGVANTAAEGTTASTTVPFAATGCRGLAFAPVLKAETSGKRWKDSGASLKVTVSQPLGQTNLARVAVRLPDGLAARGTTIRKACSSDQWATQSCPASTRAGTARAVTPILGAPLAAGVYFVGRPKGSSGLPQLRMLLRGAGIEVELVGDVVVDKTGKTTTTFPAIPDVPISEFEMNLPQGPNSLLAANKPLCSSGALPMRTELAGQNGARRVRTTAVKVVGCPSARKKKAGRASSRHA